MLLKDVNEMISYTNLIIHLNKNEFILKAHNQREGGNDCWNMLQKEIEKTKFMSKIAQPLM